MSRYQKPNPTIWTGRTSEEQLYLHEKVSFLDIEKHAIPKKSIALLGYACDEGVSRNLGRIGAAKGPDAIRKSLAVLPNHLSAKTYIYDIGNIRCTDANMEGTQHKLSEIVSELLAQKSFPILLGGGHDIAYGHYTGIRKHIGKSKNIGVINFDAHFDLRSNKDGNNSGTPFYQIAQDAKVEKSNFKYLALGIRKDANDRALFETANELGVNYLENKDFKLGQLPQILKVLSAFKAQVDVIYVTIDLDGFSSAFAPGVSAASPMGFSPEIVLKCLQYLIDSRKVASLDIAELNPTYDIDNHTAKLAASLVHSVMHSLTI